MEESKSGEIQDGSFESFILQFKASSNFTIVLEFPCLKDLQEHQERIEDAGLECTRLKKFNVKFDHADMCLDLRNAKTAIEFDLEDFL